MLPISSMEERARVSVICRFVEGGKWGKASAPFGSCRIHRRVCAATVAVRRALFGVSMQAVKTRSPRNLRDIQGEGERDAVKRPARAAADDSIDPGNLCVGNK